MKKLAMLLSVFAAIVLVLGMAAVAEALVLDFEDLYPGYESYDPIPSGYKGFNWSSNAYWITDKHLPGSGYDYGTIGKVSLFTAYAADISMSDGYWDFNGAYITAAWNTGQDVTVEGWQDGSLIYSTTIITSYDGPYWFDFNYENIDTVWFRPGDLGTNAGLGGSGHHIVIDNINAPIPEPTTLFLLGSGLIGLAGLGRKTFKR